jgi:hypothetical protein
MLSSFNSHLLHSTEHVTGYQTNFELSRQVQASKTIFRRDYSHCLNRGFSSDDMESIDPSIGQAWL